MEERILDERRTQNRKLQASLEQLDAKPQTNSLAQSFSKVYEPLEGKLTELRQLFHNETLERQAQFEKLQRQLNWFSPNFTKQAKDISLPKDATASVLNLESPNADLEVSGDGMLVPLTSAGFAAVKALRNHQGQQLQILLQAEHSTSEDSNSDSKTTLSQEGDKDSQPEPTTSWVQEGKKQEAKAGQKQEADAETKAVAEDSAAPADHAKAKKEKKGKKAKDASSEDEKTEVKKADVKKTEVKSSKKQKSSISDMEESFGDLSKELNTLSNKKKL